ncbi:MAG: hypothetical protein IT235_00175, partial [Bacteroidia bacterium]|nr:hypothetical protein [Bacteroidia bacterium]
SSPNPITFEEMIRGTLWHPVSFIKKNLFEKYGYYNEKLKIASDYEFFLKTIFIHNVSHRHISIPISVFKNDGIGSSKEFELLHQQERRLVQLNFFPEKVIESALRLSNMKRSKPIIISSWLTNKPILKKIVSFAYHMFKPFK